MACNVTVAVAPEDAVEQALEAFAQHRAAVIEGQSKLRQLVEHGVGVVIEPSNQPDVLAVDMKLRHALDVQMSKVQSLAIPISSGLSSRFVNHVCSLFASRLKRSSLKW